jgi:hypothetical protein
VLSVAGPWLIHQAAAAMGRLYTTLFRICKPVFSLFLCRTSLQETCLSGQDQWKNPNTFRDAREFRVTARWTVMTTEKLIFIVYNFFEKCLNRSSLVSHGRHDGAKRVRFIDFQRSMRH